MGFPNNEFECRLLYLDIYNTCSFIPQNNLYIKHYKETDVCESEKVKSESLLLAKKEKLLSESEKLDLLDSFNHWSKAEEQEYQDLKQEIDALKFSLKKLVIPQQIEHLGQEIKDKEQKFLKKAQTRFELLGLTKEAFANRKASEFHVLKSFYKDKTLNIPAFTDEEINTFSDSDVDKLTFLYKDLSNTYSEKTFKKIAVCPFFLNTFLLAEGSLFEFWGKPISQLSTFQIALSNKGRYYKDFICEQDIKQPPEEFYDDLDQVINHFDMQRSILISKIMSQNKQKN